MIKIPLYQQRRWLNVYKFITAESCKPKMNSNIPLTSKQRNEIESPEDLLNLIKAREVLRKPKNYLEAAPINDKLLQEKPQQHWATLRRNLEILRAFVAPFKVSDKQGELAIKLATTTNDYSYGENDTFSAEKLESVGRHIFSMALSQYLMTHKDHVSRTYRFTSPNYHRLQERSHINGFDFAKIEQLGSLLEKVEQGSDLNLIVSFLSDNSLMFRTKSSNKYYGYRIPILNNPKYKFKPSKGIWKQVLLCKRMLFKVPRKTKNPFISTKSYIRKVDIGPKKEKEYSRLLKRNGNKFFYILIGIMNEIYGLKQAIAFVHSKVLMGQNGILKRIKKQ